MTTRSSCITGARAFYPDTTTMTAVNAAETDEMNLKQPRYHDDLAEARAYRYHALFDYTDYSSHPVEEEGDMEEVTPKRSKGGSSSPAFPDKLFQMLEDVAARGEEDIVSWLPHGRCFLVHKQDEFVKTIMPKYFKQSRYASFLRQLSMYGFARLTHGRDVGAYYHELFLKSRKDLLKKLVRVRSSKGLGYKMPSKKCSQPDFYLMKPMGATPPKIDSSAKTTTTRTIQKMPSTAFPTIPENPSSYHQSRPTEVACKAYSIITEDDDDDDDEDNASSQGNASLRPLRFPGFLRNVFEQERAPATPELATVVDGGKHSVTKASGAWSVEPIENTSSQTKQCASLPSFRGDSTEANSFSISLIDMKQNNRYDSFDDPLFWLL